MKKFYFLTASLVISLLFCSYCFYNQYQQEKYLNEMFSKCIDETDCCFGIDYTKLDDSTKDYYLEKMYSNLFTASNILQFTSYANVENKEKNSENAISKLYLLLISCNHSNNKLDKIITRQDIFNYLHFISIDPQNKYYWIQLTKVENEIEKKYSIVPLIHRDIFLYANISVIYLNIII